MIYDQDDNLPHGPGRAASRPLMEYGMDSDGDALALMVDEVLEWMAFRCVWRIVGGASTLDLELDFGVELNWCWRVEGTMGMPTAPIVVN